MKSSKNKSVSISIDDRVSKDIKGIPKEDIQRIFKAIDKLKFNPELGKPLEGPLNPLRKLTVGNYRVIYVYEDSILRVLIIKVGHRKSVYEELKRLIPYIKL